MSIYRLFRIFSIGFIVFLSVACGCEGPACEATIQAAVAGTLTAQPTSTPTPAPTFTSMPTPPPTPRLTLPPTSTFTPVPTPTSTTVDTPSGGTDLFIDITCPDIANSLMVTKVVGPEGESWRYMIAGSVSPPSIPPTLTVNVVYKRTGTNATDWIFVNGRGAKPDQNGKFVVDGWIGTAEYRPEEGELVAVAVALMDEDQAAGENGKTYNALMDVPAAAFSFDRTYRLTLDQEAFSCRDDETVLPSCPDTPYTLIPTCPDRAALTTDPLQKTWRYAIGGVVQSDTPIPENLTLNIIYKRGGERPTNWIFVDGGGAKSYPSGQFLVEGFIGTWEYPPNPGERFGIVVALVDEAKAKTLDNVAKVSPCSFDAVSFSDPIYVRIREEDEAKYRCPYPACDPDQPPPAGEYSLCVTCPAPDGALTVDSVSPSWRYQIGGVIQPNTIPENSALFVAYKRLEGPNASGGTKWTVIDKPALPKPLNPPQAGKKQFQAEGWIGNMESPAQPGEPLAVAVVLMDIDRGLELGNPESPETFATLEEIPATYGFSPPVYVHIRKDDEAEHRCQGAELSGTPIVPTNTPAPLQTGGPALLHEMDSDDVLFWHKADGWTNGDPFWTGWRADHVEFADGFMRLRLDDQPCTTNAADCSGQPYASGEYRSNNSYPYGCFEGRIKAAKGSGLVTSFFTFYATVANDYQDADEIDIEILGKDTTQMQVNYRTNGVGHHEVMIDLGFDASQDFHTYAFEWSPTAIKWYVDGNLVHTEDGSRGPLPVTPGRIMMNLWPGIGVDGWLGPFAYPGSPIYTYYDWIKFTPSSCPYQ